MKKVLLIVFSVVCVGCMLLIHKYQTANRNVKIESIVLPVSIGDPKDSLFYFNCTEDQLVISSMSFLLKNHLVQLAVEQNWDGKGYVVAVTKEHSRTKTKFLPSLSRARTKANE